MDQGRLPRRLYRQGDVLLISIDEIPAAEQTAHDLERGVVLAEGEVTGHAHRIASRHAALYGDKAGARFLRVWGPRPVALVHEEHRTVEIPPGKYQVVIHHEYRPGTYGGADLVDEVLD